MPGQPTIPRTCEQCGEPFLTHASKIAQGKGKYCSPACGYAARRQSPADRFWAKVDRSGGPDACWPWQAGRHEFGYGKFWIAGRTVIAHHFAYELVKGPLPEEKPYALHQCDNPPCCNPAHLFPGTNQDNVDDMWAKGRGIDGDQHYTRRHPEWLKRGDESWSATHPERLARGERHPKAKLSADQVREIRERHATGVAQRALAREHGVTRQAIKAVIRRESWSHVP